ncbi:transposase [Microvirga roseola]|uniref:transposase n=1 Tax=Microvirga roseola TaxID=2883126 RepID=UPI002AC355A7|nr:transposase [Microvirga roseola]
MDWDDADARLQDKNYRRVEVVTCRRQRRCWTPSEKARIVAVSVEPGANISAVARRWGAIAGFLRFGDGKWRHGGSSSACRRLPRCASGLCNGTSS